MILAKKSLILLVALFLSSCASIFTGIEEKIIFRSEEDDTFFYYNDTFAGKGKSTSVRMRKKNLDKVQLRGEKNNCTPKTQPVITEFNPLSLLGFFIDAGIVSIVIVDWAATGAIEKAAQTTYDLTPDCNKQRGGIPANFTK